MMKPTDFGELNHHTHRRGLNRPAQWRVLGKPEMCSRRVVVAEIT